MKKECNVTFRQAKPGEESFIESLYLQKVEELAAKGLVQWEREEVLWETMSKEYDISQFYLVSLQDEVVGAFVVIDYDPTYWLEDKPKEALYIHKVMVLDKANGLGVSDQILTFFKKMGKAKGYPCVKLDVRAYKDKLIAFYERNGFTLVTTVDLNKGYLTRLYEYRYT